MLTDLFLYLAKATVCFVAFALVYRAFLCRLTHFQWNRIYLLSALLLSIAIPFVQLPISRPNYLPEASEAPVSLPVVSQQEEVKSVMPDAQPGPVQLIPTIQPEKTSFTIPYEALGYGLVLLYFIGVLYKAWRLGCNLRAVHRLIRRGERLEEEDYCLVYTQEQAPAFSFLHFIFLGRHHNSLSPEEWSQVINHERVHVRQKHTLDLLLFEVVDVLFWFNPLVRYLKESLQEVHEYMADAAVTQELSDHRAYGRLLVRLTVESIPFSMAHGFSGKQLKKRILMLTQTPSTPRQKLKFALAFPLLAVLSISCSMLKNDPIQPDESEVKSNLRMGSITWSGNTVYSAEDLNQALGLQPGDAYDEQKLNDLLVYDSQAGDLVSLYLNKGYYFFQVTSKQKEDGHGRVNLELAVHEGKPVKIGRIIFKGEVSLKEEALRLIGISPGELFSRKKFVEGQRALGESEAISGSLKLIPHPEQGLIDLECHILKPRPWGIVFIEKLQKDSSIVEGYARNAYTFLLDGKLVTNKKRFSTQTRGSFSLLPEEGMSINHPLKITISLKKWIGDKLEEKVSRTWEDMDQMRNFDIGEILSQSESGDDLFIQLEGAKSNCGTVMHIF
ncbi:MAG: POTRA domain-containing protein [Bacteroidota bacterium]